MRARHGFTLIELLVVAAVVAVLAAIAASNYGLASARAKVACVRSDLRLIAEALEAYSTDYGEYPPARGVGDYANPIGPFAQPVGVRLFPLTTPVAYISTLPDDQFRVARSVGGQGSDVYDTYDYVDADAIAEYGSGITSGADWRVVGPGPDLDLGVGGMLAAAGAANARGVDYDATNGVISAGDMVRVGALNTKYGDPLDPNNPARPGIARVPQYVEQWQ